MTQKRFNTTQAAHT